MCVKKDSLNGLNGFVHSTYFLSYFRAAEFVGGCDTAIIDYSKTNKLQEYE